MSDLELTVQVIAPPSLPQGTCFGTATQTRTFTFLSFPVTIGRADTCDIVVGDVMVSRRHAVVEETGGTLWLRDTGSASGTPVDGEHVRWGRWPVGDLTSVTLGQFRIHLVARRVTSPGARRRSRTLLGSPRSRVRVCEWAPLNFVARRP